MSWSCESVMGNTSFRVFGICGGWDVLEVISLWILIGNWFKTSNWGCRNGSVHTAFVVFRFPGPT